MALMKLCSRAGCNHRVPQGEMYCIKHKERSRERREINREYDRNRRNKMADEFYHSREWQIMREKILARDYGIDVYQYIKTGDVIQANTVHHITELNEDYAKRCDPNNLISVSERTHAIITKAYKGKKKAEMQKELRECLEEYERRAGRG